MKSRKTNIQRIQVTNVRKNSRARKALLSWATMVFGFLLGCRVFAAASFETQNGQNGLTHFNASELRQAGSVSPEIDRENIELLPRVSFIEKGRWFENTAFNLYGQLHRTRPDFSQFSTLRIEHLFIYQTTEPTIGEFSATILASRDTRNAIPNMAQTTQLSVRGRSHALAKRMKPETLAAMNDKIEQFKIEFTEIKNGEDVTVILDKDGNMLPIPDSNPEAIFASELLYPVLRNYYLLSPQ